MLEFMEQFRKKKRLFLGLERQFQRGNRPDKEFYEWPEVHAKEPDVPYTLNFTHGTWSDPSQGVGEVVEQRPCVLL